MIVLQIRNRSKQQEFNLDIKKYQNFKDHKMYLNFKFRYVL